MKKILFIITAIVFMLGIDFGQLHAQSTSKTETEGYLLNAAHPTGYYGIPYQLYATYESTVNFTPVDTTKGTELDLGTATIAFNNTRAGVTYIWNDTVVYAPLYGYGQVTLAYSAQLAPTGANTVTATAVIKPQRYVKGIWADIVGQTAQTITCTYAGKATPVTGGFDIAVKDGSRLRLSIVPSSDSISITGAWYLNKLVYIPSGN